MRLSLGRMSTGDILDRGLNLLFSRLHIFFTINVIVVFRVILVVLALPFVISIDSGPTSDPSTSFATFCLAMVALFFASLFQPVGTAAILHIVMQQYLGKRASLAEAFSFALSRLFTLLFTWILVSLIIGVGLVCACIPGFYLMVCYSFVIQAVTLEKLGMTQGLQRSYNLGDGYRFRVLGMLMVIIVAGAILSYFIDLGLEKVIPVHESIPAASGTRSVLKPWNYAIVVTVIALVDILFYTYFAVCATLVYLDLRIRKEGFDLELAIQSQEEANGTHRDRDRDRDDDRDERDRRRLDYD